MHGCNKRQVKTCLYLIFSMVCIGLLACVNESLPVDDSLSADDGSLFEYASCTDGLDNDDDGWFDGDDPDCAGEGALMEKGYSVSSCNDGIDNDGDMLVDNEDYQCLHALDERESLSPGDVVITEFMVNPALVSDADGEWFEIYNNTAGNIELENWSIEDGGGVHVIEGSLIISSGAYLVLSRAAIELNGLSKTDYVYGTSIYFGNTGDDIRLINPESEVIHSISYTDSDIVSGASTIVDGMLFQGGYIDDPDRATDSSSWCISMEAYLTDSDAGSPGEKNELCL